MRRGRMRGGPARQVPTGPGQALGTWPARRASSSKARHAYPLQEAMAGFNAGIFFAAASRAGPLMGAGLENLEVKNKVTPPGP